MRLFVAVELDRGLRQALARAWEQRQTELCAGIRSVGEERLHLTLRFVGETADERIADVVAAAEAAAARFEPFSFAVRGLGAFPRPRSAKVFWAGLEPCPVLEQLARTVDRELRERRFPPEPRRFSPHVTLARAKGPPVRLAAALEPDLPRFGEQEVDAVTVLESRLSPRGPVYVPVARLPLSEGAGPRVGP